MVSAKQRRLSRDATQLAAAVPQVIAHRVTRTLAPGALLNGRDQREMVLMSAEKVAAFYESWAAMSAQTLAAQGQFAMWWMQTWWKVALGGWMNPPTWGHLSWSAQQRLLSSMLDVTHRGIAPVRRRAVANARRLNRSAR